MIKCLRSVFTLFALVTMTSSCEKLPSPTGPTPPISPAPPSPGTGTTPRVVPWNELPPLSEAAKSFIVDHNLNRIFQGGDVGVVKVWRTFPITVSMTEDFSRQNVIDALNFWTEVSEGKITFRLVPVEERAMITLDTVWPRPGMTDDVAELACGVGSFQELSQNVVLSGFASFSFKINQRCTGNRILIAHELGHALGLLGHTASGDVISTSNVAWNATPLLREIVNWLYAVGPNVRPV